MSKLMRIQSVLAVLVVFFLFMPNESFAALVRAPSNSGLVGCWKFDEGRGTTAGDCSGKGNNGILSGATKPSWVAGKHAEALSFDGSTGYVDAGQKNSNFQYNNAFTISVWAKVSSCSQSSCYFVTKYTDTPTFKGYFLGYSSGVAYLQIQQSGAIYRYRLGSTIVNNNRWHHIVGVSDGTGNSTGLHIYVDGKEETYSDTQTAGAITDITNSTNLYVGQRGNFYYMGGLIDDVRIYNRALSLTEIQTLHKSGETTVSRIEPVRLNKGLVGYWSFDGSTLLNNVADLSGQSNYGLLQPTTATSSMKDVGKVGQGLKFNGLSQYVNIPDVSNKYAFANTTFTVSFWLKTTGNSATQFIVANSDNVLPGWSVAILSSGLINAGTKGTFGQTSASRSGVSVLNDGKWHQVTVIITTDTVSTPGANNVTIYSDGVLGQGALSGTVPYDIPTTATIFGKRPAGSLLKGSLDDVRIYNRALSAAEINALYKMGQETVNKTDTTGISSGLVGYWTFDGKDTTTNIIDVSGNGNHGLLQPTTATSSMKVAGKIGQGLKFNGTNQYVERTSAPGLNITNKQLTVSSWVKIMENQRAVIGSIASRARTTTYAYNLNIRLDQPNKPSFGMYDGSTNPEVVATNAISKGAWHHVVGTYNGTHMNIYVDGVVAATPVSTTIDISSASDTFRIGLNAGSISQYYFNGLIDDVRVYNRSLSAAEVKQLWNMGR